jgi:hypothetical protein
MAELLLDNGLATSKQEQPVRSIARSSTLIAVRRLDADRKGILVQFLSESNLISKIDPIIDLSGADLSDADLSGANLNGANLSHANLVSADLRFAKGWTNEQLAQVETLVGATMPDRMVMTQEDWEEFKKRYGQ